MFSYIICVRVSGFYGDSSKGRAPQARSIFCSFESFVGDVYRSMYGKLNTTIALVIINTRRNPYRTNVPTPFVLGCGLTLPSSIPTTVELPYENNKMAHEACRVVPW